MTLSLQVPGAKVTSESDTASEPSHLLFPPPRRTPELLAGFRVEEEH
jgi:hypothetical protein